MPWTPRQARFDLAALALASALSISLLAPAPTASARPGLNATGLAAATVVVTTTSLAAPKKGLAATLRRMRRLVNVTRATPQTCGEDLLAAAPPLRRDKRLNKAATKYARKMARKDWFDHDAPNGTGPGERINDEGYRWSTWSENIAAGYDSVPSVLAGWLASPGHCRTLMGPYKHVGFGYAYSEKSTFGHYWVQDVASPR